MSARYGSPTGVNTHYGNTGLGVLGAVIRANTATGDAGPGYLYNDWQSAADDSVEMQGLIVTPPSVGTFFAFEDGSFTLIGAPDGGSTFVYRLIADGVDKGTATASIAVGASGGITGNITLDDATPAGVLFGQIGISGSIVLDDATAAGVLTGVLPLSVGEMRQMFGWVSDLARIHGLILGQPLVVTPTQRSAGAVVQTISEAGTTVTVALQ